MKLLVNLSIIFAVFLLFTSCAAKKELVDLKKTHQEQKEIFDQREQQASLLNAQLTNEKKSKIVLQEKYDYLQRENEQLRKRLIAARISLNEISAQEPECPEAMEKGIVFKVQIGAYEERELSESIVTSVNIDTEKKNDMQKIVIGQFRAYQKADRLKEQLRVMGVEDAWIVSYKDGKRVSIEIALSEQEKGQ